MDTILPVLISAGSVFFAIFHLGNQRRGGGMPSGRRQRNKRQPARSGSGTTAR